MSEELSRVKSRQKQHKSESKHPGKSKKEKRTSEAVKKAAPEKKSTPIKKNATARVSTATLSRKARRPAGSAKRSSTGSKEKDEESVPSRSDTYSSEKVRLSKMFVNSLIFIFVILLIGLLWWGIEGAPPLSTLW
ncbi:hypothetical protein NST28_20835 [Paenibacillus sp. FSL R10-2791]|uniref:hypothetical protein n=1 Tax=unclassified Paenibacillus TaxID=185978 RepID=UPI0030FC38BB